MQYNKDSHINNVDDVRKFFRYIVDERNVNFNPDDMFEDQLITYINDLIPKLPDRRLGIKPYTDRIGASLLRHGGLTPKMF